MNEEEELEALRALMGDSSKHLKVREKDFEGQGNVTLLGNGALKIDHPSSPSPGSSGFPNFKALEQSRELTNPATPSPAMKTRPLVTPASQTSSASTRDAENPAALISLSNGLAEIQKDASELPSDSALLSALVAYPRKPPPGSRCPFPHV